MFIATLLAFFSLLFAFRLIGTLASVPFAEWNALFLVYIGLLVILLVVFIYAVRLFIRKYKKQVALVNEQEKKAQEIRRAKRRALYLEEDIDIEAEAEKAEKARLAAERAEMEKAAGEDETAESGEDEAAEAAENSESEAEEKSSAEQQ